MKYFTSSSSEDEEFVKPIKSTQPIPSKHNSTSDQNYAHLSMANLSLMTPSRELMPNAVTVFLPDDKRDNLMSINSFKQILCDPKIADKKVCVVSVVGKFRTGKSFLLNVFLRYLNHLESGGLVSDESWLTNESTLAGFSWRNGESPDTIGILVWSHPFILKSRNGEETVILLVDTQGSFDNSSTFKDCASVFALSTLISSLQIYNLRGNIDSSDLEHLSFFANYGALAMENQEDSKPFQSLLFLIRDWSLSSNYGFSGGQAILEKRLNGNGQPAELIRTCSGIKNSFEQLKCFLMAPPGIRIMENDTDFGELESKFVEQLYSLVPSVFSGKNLVPKKINGEAITCKQLFGYFEMYSKVFCGDSLPNPQSLLLSQIEISHSHAIEKAIELYESEMSAFSEDDDFFTSDALFLKQHELAAKKASECFIGAKRIGQEQTHIYVEKFITKIEPKYQELRKVNAAKEEKARIQEEKAMMESKLKAEKLEVEMALKTQKESYDDLSKQIEKMKQAFAVEGDAKRREHAKSLNYAVLLTICDDYAQEVEELLSRNSIITEAEFFEKNNLVRENVMKEFETMLTGNNEIRAEFIQSISNRLYKIQRSIYRKIQAHNANVELNEDDKAQVFAFNDQLTRQLEEYKRALEAANNQNARKKKKDVCGIF